MAPDASAEDRRKELKAKLAAKTASSHKARKDTKEEAKKKEEEKARKEAKAKADKEAEDKRKADLAAQARAAAAAAPPSVWADEKDEASQIGIHLGISCDGCGHTPPLIGKAMKCRDCPDFDLCEKCYPLRLDKGREEIAAKAGMAGKGRHPANHTFGPRKAAVVMTREAVEKEIAAAENDKKMAAAKEAARAAAGDTKAGAGAGDAGRSDFVFQPPKASSGASAEMVAQMVSQIGREQIWRPSAQMVALLPTPQGHPRSHRPKE